MANTDLIKVKHNKGCIQRIHLQICAQRLSRECDESFGNHELPLIPIARNKHMKKWPDHVGIVNIASKGFYLGVKYGYNDSNVLHEIAEGLEHELYDDIITIVIEYTMKRTIKEWILEPLEFINIVDNYHIDMDKYSKWIEKKNRYNKWVTNIQINYFDRDVQQIIDKYEMDEIDGGRIRQCFAENGVNYRYLEIHKRGEFIQLLSSDPCNFSVGKGTKIYREFSQYAEIIIKYAL